MWGLDCKQSWALKSWCFWTVVLEKTLESPLDCKEIQPVHPKGDQSWVFFGRTDAEAETPVLWPPHAKSWLIWKDPDAGKDWGQKEKGDDRGWDGWMASPTQWTWVWMDSGSWWWTGRPGMLRFMGSQSQKWLSNWTELNWTMVRKLYCNKAFFLICQTAKLYALLKVTPQAMWYQVGPGTIEVEELSHQPTCVHIPSIFLE